MRSRRCLFPLLMILVFGLFLALCSTALAAPPGDAALDGNDLSAILGSSLSWQDKLGLFLTNPVVSTVLLILGIVGISLEIATVGSFGGFGVLGGLSFLLYFMGSFWAGSFSSLAVLLLLLGVILLVLEIFVIPGFGVCGGLGILSILGSLILAAPDPATAIWSLLIALLVSALLIYYTVKNKKTRLIWEKLILFQRLDKAGGFDSVDPSLSRLLGQRGTALTTLRPAGSALINGEKVDVLSQGEFIEAGQSIEVILVEGMRIVVRLLSEEE
ncbi:MAG: NfeD family protein [Bacillota bacterium]|nr:NfeD family protein [Bacillota bacterium]